MVLVGCGRVAFDPSRDADADADANADASADSGIPPRWALVQTVASRVPMQRQVLRMDPLGSQHLIVVAVQVPDDGRVTAITDTSNCNSYTAIPTAHSTNADAGDELEIFYAKSSCPGADAISIDATTEVTAAAWEASGIRTDDPFDMASTLNEQPETAMPLGPIITTSTAGEFVVSVAIVANEVSGIHPGNEFTNDHLANGNAWAHLTDPMAPAGTHQAQWDPPPPPAPSPGSYCASAAAFKVGP
jgi:hypothetical protein